MTKEKFFVTLKGTGEILCYFYEKGKKNCYFGKFLLLYMKIFVTFYENFLLLYIKMFCYFKGNRRDFILKGLLQYIKEEKLLVTLMEKEEFLKKNFYAKAMVTLVWRLSSFH